MLRKIKKITHVRMEYPMSQISDKSMETIVVSHRKKQPVQYLV
jgi:hypothetical protein